MLVLNPHFQEPKSFVGYSGIRQKAHLTAVTKNIALFISKNASGPSALKFLTCHVWLPGS